ncbi:MAG: MraY family glycosyltransferase, partial [Granulosicoccus sp.]
MLAVILCAISCAIFICLLESIAPKFSLIDVPSGRKHHDGEIPVIGGMAIFASIVFTLLVLNDASAPPALLAVSFVILLVGTVDDAWSISARLKLLAQLLLSLVMVLWGDMRIETIGGILGSEPVDLQGMSSIVFSVICIVGVINAINMIDGLDGLAGSLLFVSFVAIGFLSAETTDTRQTVFIMCIAGSLLAFLCYNSRLARPTARVFLGDAGSMMLGLMLAWYLISLSQNQGQSTVFSAVSMVWLFGLPLMETLVLVINRILEKRSPFDAGRDHMHHKLINAGLSVNATVFVMAFVHVCFVSIGVMFSDAKGA